VCECDEDAKAEREKWEEEPGKSRSTEVEGRR